MKKSELTNKTVAELRVLARELGMTGYSGLKKAELVDRLAASQKPAASGRPEARGAAKRAPKKDARTGAAKATSGPSTPPRKKAPAAKRASATAKKADAVKGVEGQQGRGLSPRTRRAFSVYRAMGEQRVKASKYYLGVKESPEIDDGFTFPMSHGENMVFLMVRDPYWLFAYWEFSPDLNAELVERIGEEALLKSRLVLRVYDVTGTSADEPVGHRDIDVSPGARDWYINVTRVESEYCVDIGLVLPDGTFIVIARSNRVALPPIGPSPEVDEQWVTIESLGEIYTLTERGPTSGSGGWGSGGWGQG